jgi:hypothetical protein
MRDLHATKNILEIVDPISGDVHEIYYRTPTNSERIAYAGALIRREGRKIRLRADTYSINVQYGLDVITGFKKGTIGYNGKKISSDVMDPDFFENWKELLAQSAPEIAAAVGQTVFAGARVRRADDGQDAIAFVEMEDLGSDPLPCASNDTCSAAIDGKKSAAHGTTDNG